MRIVVTGASGNVGTALLRRLGGHDVVAVARRLPAAVPPYQSARWVPLDLGDPGAAGRLAADLAGADAVVHLAWQIQPSHDREQLRRTNVGGTRAVIEAVRESGVHQLVHVSSIGTYAPAPPNRWIDETWPTTGVTTSSYSVDKAACERMLDQVDDIPLVARIRPSFILQPEAASEIARYFIGPFVPLSMLHPALLRFAPWPRELALQVVHADDVADAITRVVEREASGAFNLAAEPAFDRAQARRLFGGVGPSLPIALARPMADAAWRMRLQPTEPGFIDLARGLPLLRCEPARRGLGWRPAYGADDVLSEFLYALRTRRSGPGPLLHPRRLLSS